MLDELVDMAVGHYFCEDGVEPLGLFGSDLLQGCDEIMVDLQNHDGVVHRPVVLPELVLPLADLAARTSCTQPPRPKVHEARGRVAVDLCSSWCRSGPHLSRWRR